MTSRDGESIRVTCVNTCARAGFSVRESKLGGQGQLDVEQVGTVRDDRLTIVRLAAVIVDIVDDDHLPNPIDNSIIFPYSPFVVRLHLFRPG
jgi:hypothetical protein